MSMATDYCSGEWFEANCTQDEVIVMTSAVYGRMRLGRCIGHDFGFIGCQKDVLDAMDEACSGRQACELLITEENVHGDAACPEDFTGYAQISHHCQEGAFCKFGYTVVSIT